jgi:chemotaxis protein methyltransferase CheR
MSASTGATMSDKQFEKLRSVIYERSGIHFPDAKKYVLESRLGRRLAELEMDDYDQYTAYLTMGPYQKDEFQEMFDRITINETSFFRNEPQLDVFEKQILPELIEARKNTRRLRFWSAACSSGEEPYTLAMQVHRSLGVRLPDWRIEILGTDISDKVLEIAQEGRYTDYSMRTTPAMVKQRYFKQDGAYWVVNDAIRTMVNFELHNLKDRLAAKRHGTWDVIFCRNVMIYFDEAMKTQVLMMFHDQLESDGALFIGHSESIKAGSVPLVQIPVSHAFCYRRAGKPASVTAAGIAHAPAAGTVAAPKRF